MRFELIAALRFLREGRFQTALIIGGVAIGCAVVIFITALIGGLQADIVDKTLGTQPHIVLRPPDDEASLVIAAETGVERAALVEKRAQRLRSIDEWRKVAAEAERTAGVTAVSPMVSGPGFATRGEAEKSVAILGVTPELYTRVVPVDKKMVRGVFDLTGDNAAIGTDLSSDLGVGIGDKIRLVGTGGRTRVITVAGVFDMGLRDLNRRWVFVAPRSAENLLNLAGGVTNIDIKVDSIFEAEKISSRLASVTGQKSESWMKTNAELVAALRGQTGATLTIRFFVTISVAFSIASVLVVSVVQKSREIGILRAMGASPRSIMTVFLVQGGIVGLGGSILGSAIGGWFALLFQTWVKLFSVRLNPELFAYTVLGAVLVGTLSAIAPSLRAARLEPVTAIRHG